MIFYEKIYMYLNVSICASYVKSVHDQLDAIMQDDDTQGSMETHSFV